jgi:hypothetical protein
LGLGVVAARALTNTGDVSVTGLRGRQLEVPGVEPAGLVVYCTYHPAAVLHGATHLAKRIVEDLRRFDAAPRALPAGELPQDLHTLGVDLEWSADGELLTIGLADEKHAYAFDAG